MGDEVLDVLSESLGVAYKGEFIELFLGYLGLVGQTHPGGICLVDYLGVGGEVLFDCLQGLLLEQVQLLNG